MSGVTLLRAELDNVYCEFLPETPLYVTYRTGQQVWVDAKYITWENVSYIQVAETAKKQMVTGPVKQLKPREVSTKAAEDGKITYIHGRVILQLPEDVSQEALFRAISFLQALQQKNSADPLDNHPSP